MVDGAVAAERLVLARRSDNGRLTSRIDPAVAQCCGQTELAEAIQASLRT
jgi:hypothetical protein